MEKHALTTTTIAAELPKGVDFQIADRGDYFEVQHEYIEDTELYGEVCDAIERLGGKTPGQYYSGAAHYKIPKREVEAVKKITEAKPLGEATAEEVDAATVEQLKRSAIQQGELLPVIKDQHGNIISGRHRKAANPDWRETTIMVSDELDRLLKIIHFNVQRRPSREETAARLLKIAKILENKGVPKSDIAQNMSEIVPYSERYIRSLLPDEYKHVEMKREVLGEPKFAELVPQTPSTTVQFKGIQESITAEMRTCEKCGAQFHRSRGSIVGGQIVCPKCAGKEKVPVEPPKPEVKGVKPKDTWAQRKVQMQPAVSIMDQHTYYRLKQDKEIRDAGWEVTFQKPYILTTSDVTLEKPGVEIPIFLDLIELHQKREDRDSQIRGFLLRREKIKEVLSLPYKNLTKAEKDRVFQEIKQRAVSMG